MKILDVFGKGKKAKSQKEGINIAAEEADEYQLPYFLDDEKKKKGQYNHIKIKKRSGIRWVSM